MKREPETIEQYVERALAARREQGLPDGIEDDDTLDFLAEVLARPVRRCSRLNATRGAPAEDAPLTDSQPRQAKDRHGQR
jgi:hypothetical protein